MLWWTHPIGKHRLARSNEERKCGHDVGRLMWCSIAVGMYDPYTLGAILHRSRRQNVGPPLGAGSLGGVARTAILTNVWGGDLCQRPRDGNCNNPAHRSSLAADPLTQKRQFGPAGLSDE